MKVQFITDWQQVPLIIDLPFAARLLGCTVETLKKRAQRGELPGAFKNGAQWRILKDTFRQHIENLIKEN